MTFASRKTTLQLAELLGLNTNRLVSFSVHCAVDQLVQIRATYIAEQPSDGEFAKIERRFTLMEDPQS